MQDQETVTNTDPYESLRLALQRFPKARIPTREQFDAVNLRAGKGSGKEGDHCAVQVVRIWEGLDAKSDSIPETDSQVCGRFLRRFQDAIKDDAIRNRLIPPLMVKLVGSAGSPEIERRRSWIAVDWALREVAPTYFDMSPELAIHAEALRALPPITCKADATAAYTVNDAARSAAWNLRQAKLAEFREKFRVELAKHPELKDQPEVEAAAVAAAAVAAVEVAVAAAAVVEVAVAAVAAVAVAAVEVAAVEVAAVEVAAVVGSPFYWQIRAAVHDAVRKHLRESTDETLVKLRAIQAASWESGAKALERMLDCKEDSAAA